MLQFLKDIFGIEPDKDVPTPVGETPQKEESNSLLVKISRHSPTSDNYIIEYKYGKFSGWKTITRTINLYDKLSGLERNHPVLGADFDQLVERAKRDFDTIEKIRAWEEEQDKIYEENYERLKAIEESKNKSIELEF